MIASLRTWPSSTFLVIGLSATTVVKPSLAQAPHSTAAPVTLSTSEIFRRYAGAVAIVEVFADDSTEPNRFGTGVVLRERGVVVTNAHVIGDARRILQNDAALSGDRGSQARALHPPPCPGRQDQRFLESRLQIPFLCR